jgi:hypothetical protein
MPPNPSLNWTRHETIAAISQATALLTEPVRV